MKPLKAKSHLERVAELPCCVTGKFGVQLHHIKAPYISEGVKASDWFVIPLAPEIHANFHDWGRREWEMVYGSQLRYVEMTLEKLYS